MFQGHGEKPNLDIIAQAEALPLITLWSVGGGVVPLSSVALCPSKNLLPFLSFHLPPSSSTVTFFPLTGRVMSAVQELT